MAGFTTAYEQIILDLVFGGVAYTAETSLKIDLLTTQPSDDAGSGLVKASYTGYSQQTLTNNATNFPNATGGTPTIKSNGTLISFGQKTNVGNITATGFAIYENDGTTLIFIGTFTPSQVVSQNDTPQFAIGDMDLKLGDPGDTY